MAARSEGKTQWVNIMNETESQSIRVIECRGSHAKIGETIGEELREYLQGRIRGPRMDEQHKRMQASLEPMQVHMPEVLEQIRGIERGGVLAEGSLLREWTETPRHSMFETGCSNVVFADGPDGPLWGKNNDGDAGPQPAAPAVHCILKIYPDDGVPLINCTYSGWVAAGDILNAEGVASGWSSGSSPFRQSPFHVSDRLWAYAGMLRARTAEEFARHITALPLRGKGYTGVTIDENGTMFSTEIMSPLVQLRRPAVWMRGMNCTNWYQDPHLKSLCFRSHLDNAASRSVALEEALKEDRLDVEHMKATLRCHGAADICRHGEVRHDHGFTEWSAIGVVRERKLLFCEGAPCQGEYREIRL